MSAQSNIQWVDSIVASELTELFNINAPQFLALANPEQFNKLKQSLAKIDIQEALTHLDKDSYLEITLPVLGMADFLSMHLKNSVWNELAQSFPSVLSIHGWVGGRFSRPDFVVVRDIIGNEYEIIVNQQGQVEIPTDGTGHFSMLSEITLMYAFDQVIEGRGFEKESRQEAEINQIGLLPPPHISSAFSVTVRVTGLDAHNHRQVEFEQMHFFGVNPDRKTAGLTEFGARSLMRHVFSEFDFIKCLWGGKGELDFGILHPNHFNDFRLSYEALGIYYNTLVKAVIHQRLPYEFLLSKIPSARFSTLPLLEGPFDQEDRSLIQRLGIDALQTLSMAPPRRPQVLNKEVSLQCLLTERQGEQNNYTKVRK